MTTEVTTTEYVVWGIPKGETDEQVLYTKAQTMERAEKAKALLESKHGPYGCTQCRIQVVDMGVDDVAQRFGGR